MSDLDPGDVADVAPEAIVDNGVPGQWRPIVDPVRLVPKLWRRLAQAWLAIEQAVAVLHDHAAEIRAIEETLGTDPQGNRGTVRERLEAIEARLTVVEKNKR